MASRRNSFGTIISTGTRTQPAFGIRWWEGSRRRKRSGYRTRTEAADALARVRTALADGVLVQKRRGAIGFDKAANQWFDLHATPSLRNAKQYRDAYETHVEPFFGDCPLASVTADRILELRARMQAKTFGKEKRKYKPNTVNRVMALVRAILRFAVANGHLPSSPTERLARGQLLLPVPKTKLAPPIAKAKDVGRLLAAIAEEGRKTRRPWLHPLFALLAYTGIRIGEAMGLRWPDVDLARRLITIRRSFETPTKSGKERLVPVPTELVQILEKHKKADPWNGDLVFPSPDGDVYTRDGAEALRRPLRAALKACKLPQIRIHDLRHTFASHFVMAAGDIFTLQQILGHSTPRLTADTYAHLAKDYLAGAADRVSYPAPRRRSGVVVPIRADAARNPDA